MKKIEIKLVYPPAALVTGGFVVLKKNLLKTCPGLLSEEAEVRARGIIRTVEACIENEVSLVINRPDGLSYRLSVAFGPRNIEFKKRVPIDKPAGRNDLN
jgi:hypothetical protein